MAQWRNVKGGLCLHDMAGTVTSNSNTLLNYSHFSQTIGALVAVSPADSPLIAKTVPTFRRRASSVAGNSNDDYILGIGRELAIRQPKSQKLVN